MNRLDFVLPDWTRVSWASQRARETWEPRVAAIVRAWSEMSFASVAEGLRGAHLELLNPIDLPALVRKAGARGLVVLPLSRVQSVAGGRPNGAYTARANSPVDGAPWQYRAVVTAPDAIPSWLEGLDDRRCGALLGYPPCCVEFFAKHWVDEAWIDTTYPMSLAGTEGPAEGNILLRWLGLRLVNHLPCSFGCEATAAVGRRYYELGIRLGFEDEMGWLRELLSWPVQWSALHGVAEILTPVCRISTVTDATADKVVVRRAGDRYPDEGAKGLAFPFRQDDAPAAVIPAAAEWEDNGFTRLDAMLDAHRTVIHAARSAPIGPGRVLDLGCGDGRLVAKVCALDGSVPFGVECDSGRAGRAGLRLGAANVAQGNLADTAPWAGTYSLCLLMPGRLAELDAADRENVLTALRSRCTELLLYAYADNLGGADLPAVAQANGLDVACGVVVSGPQGQAARARWR